MSRAYMIRHGRPNSTWSQSSDDDPGLDSTGIAQAEAARDALLALAEPFRPVSVISSPLRRCLETAAPFARALGVEVEIDPVFGEVPTPRHLDRAERPAWLRRAFAGRWGEIVGDLDYEAWRTAIHDALSKRAGAAIFSHYVALNAAVSKASGDDRVLAFRPDHASITVFEVGAGPARLISLGREAGTQVL